jgi:hypothetical protein
MFSPWGIIFFIKKYQRNLNVFSIECTGPDSGAGLNFLNHSSYVSAFPQTVTILYGSGLREASTLGEFTGAVIPSEWPSS